MGGNLAGQIVCCTPGGRQRDLQQPRGIQVSGGISLSSGVVIDTEQGYYLVGRDGDEQFTDWKVAGNFKGEDFPDQTRKILNEGEDGIIHAIRILLTPTGGLFAEVRCSVLFACLFNAFGQRMGWHLPGFDDSAWAVQTPFEGLSKAGVSDGV